MADELCLRLSRAELDELDRALEFEGYGTARNDLRRLLRERAEEAEENAGSFDYPDDYAP